MMGLDKSDIFVGAIGMAIGVVVGVNLAKRKVGPFGGGGFV